MKPPLSNGPPHSRQKKCPKCQEKIEDNDIRYLSQNSIYKNLYSHLFEAGYILPSIELETNNQSESDSGSSEADIILTKKRRHILNLIIKIIYRFCNLFWFILVFINEYTLIEDYQYIIKKRNVQLPINLNNNICF